MRPRQSAERRPLAEGAASGGGRLRLEPAVPDAGRLRQDDQGRRELGLEHGSAEAPERARHLVHAGQGHWRRILDQRAALYARQRQGLRRLGRRTRAPRAGATARFCPTSFAARTTSGWSTPIMATAGRSASPIPSIPCRSATRSCAPRRRREFPSTPISTAPSRTASATINSRPATPNALRLPAPSSSRCKSRAEPHSSPQCADAENRNREGPRGRRHGRDGRRSRDFARGSRGHRQLRRDRLAAPVAAFRHWPRRRAARRRASTVVHDLPGVGSNLQDHLDLYVISRMHRRPHLRPRRAAASHGLGRGSSTSCSRPARSRRRSSRPAASGTPTSTRARPTSSSISDSALASRPASPR